MKLLIFHVSGHHDETLVRPIWNRIIEEGIQCTLFYSGGRLLLVLAIEGVEPTIGADKIMSKVISLGQRFYPSDSAFPSRKFNFIAAIIVTHSSGRICCIFASPFRVSQQGHFTLRLGTTDTHTVWSSIS